MNTEAMELTRQFAAITRESTLTEIADAIIAAIDIDENGELTKESAAAVDALNLTLAQKADAYAIVHSQLTTRSAGNKELAAVFERRARVEKNKADRLKERLHEVMTRTGTARIEGALYNACVEQSPACVAIDDEREVPDEFVETRVERRVMKRELIDALKSGRTFGGIRLVRNTHLRFR
jgi:hypothetical protein